MSKIADDTQELVIEDVTFDEARMNFNRVLQRLFKNMVDSDSTDGSITLKIDVSLENEYIPNYDPDIEGESRRIQKPKFKHKVSSNITVKDELTGNKNRKCSLYGTRGARCTSWHTSQERISGLSLTKTSRGTRKRARAARAPLKLILKKRG